MTSTPNRGEVWLIHFDPSIGAELQKLRPAIVMSVPQVGRLPKIGQKAPGLSRGMNGPKRDTASEYPWLAENSTV